jgi:hypothetical protein
MPGLDKDKIWKAYKKDGTKESHGHAFHDGFKVGYAAAKHCEIIDKNIID